jgi:hypothetical protein
MDDEAARRRAGEVGRRLATEAYGEEEMLSRDGALESVIETGARG